MKNALYPVTTVTGELPAPCGWQWRLLNEVARLESGHTPSRRQSEYWGGGNIPWLSLKDIRHLEGRQVLDTVDKPTQAGIDNSSARILPKGTVAFCRTASVGKVAILGQDMATSQDFANWVCGPGLLPEYLFEALRASGGQFDKEKQGSTHKTIYMPVLESFRVLLPPLPEQRQIADILDKADAVRRKRKEAIALTEELLRSAFLEMFGDPVTNPKGWPVNTVGAVADVQGGLQVTHARSSAPLEVPYLRVANVHRDRFSLEEVKLLRVTEAELERARLMDGDVLVVEGHGNLDEVGRAAVWIGQVENCVHQNHLIRIRCGTKMLPTFLSAFVNSEGGRRQMRVFGKTTSGLNTISTNNVRSVELLLPPMSLQRKYASLVERNHVALGRMRMHEVECGLLFDVLVHRAFRGELTQSSTPTPKNQLDLFPATSTTRSSR